MLSCIADSSPLRLAHAVQRKRVSATRTVLLCLRAPDKCKSCHSPARTWAMLFHTSLRCNNGMHIHIHSGKFALYYTLFSDDVLRLKSVIRESRYSGCFLHRKNAWNILATRGTLRPNGKQSDRTGECGQRNVHDTIEKLRSAPRSAQRR